MIPSIKYVVFDLAHGAALTRIRKLNKLINMTAGEQEEWLRE